MRKKTKIYLSELMLATMLSITGHAGATTPLGGGCQDGVRFMENGVAECVGGEEELPGCPAGKFVLDSTGVIICIEALLKPDCRLEQTPYGSKISLLAICDPEATSYEWSANAGIASSASNGLVSPVATTTYTVSGINAAGKGDAASVTVTVGATSGIPVCTLSASPASISAGSTTTLIASCSPAATSYTWSATSCSGSSATCTVAPASNTTYTIRGANSAGAGAVASATVTVSTASGRPQCTLTQMAYGSMISLLAICDPEATSYEWSANAGIASSASNGLVSPVATTTYTVSGINAAGKGDAASVTVTVGATSGIPVCTLSASPASISAGSTTTLIASCSPAATSYTWSATSCSGSSATCTVAPASNTTYTIRGANSAGAGAVASATVTVSTASGRPQCTLTQMAYGSMISLSAICSPAATSYTWTNTGFASTASNGLINPPSVTTTYSVAGVNAAGTGNTSSVTVTVANTCTLSASATSIYQGQSATLTASCTPTASSYNWNGACDAGNTTNTCVVTPNSTTSYTVTGAGGNTATSEPVTVTVKQPSCSVEVLNHMVEAGKPLKIAVGEPVALKANCAPTATEYAWEYAWEDNTGAEIVACANKIECEVMTPASTGSYSYTVTGTVSNTVVSGQVTVSVVDPFCTVTASPASIALGESATLTAECHPAAGAYAWKDEADAAICTDSATCSVEPASTGSPAYTVIGTVVGGSPISSTVTVTVVPPSCRLTANPASISLGQSTTLTASCTPAAANYDWNKVCAAGPSDTCVVKPSAAGIASYTVTGTVSGSPVAATVNVTVAAQQCTTKDVNWESGLAAYGGNGGTPVHRISTGEMQSFKHKRTYSRGYIYVAYGQPMIMTVSPTPCDFSTNLIAQGCYGGGTDPMVMVRTADYPQELGNGCTVPENGDFYINIRLADNISGSYTYYLVH